MGINSESRFRFIALVVALSFSIIAGCQVAMSQAQSHRQKAPNKLPLTFVRHSFGAYCYNAIGCRVSYDNFDFSPDPEGGDPDAYRSPPPRSPDYKSRFDAWYIVMSKDFPTPVEVRWRSLDGVAHEAKIAFEEIFRDRKVLHNVPESDYAERSFGGSVGLIFEVNDRTINVYMKALIATKKAQRPGHEHSDYRDDLVLAWSRSY